MNKRAGAVALHQPVGSFALLVAIAMLVLAVGRVTFAQTSGARFTNTPAPGAFGFPQASAELSSAHEVVRARLPGHVYDIALDSAHEHIWFAVMSSGEADLYRYDIATGLFDRWALPPTTYNGFLSRIGIAPDGSVWLTEDYTLIRFDPAANTMTTRTFALADSAAIPSALDPNNPTPGTWLAAFAFETDGRVLLSRHNVRTLTELDASLNDVTQIALPAGLVGPGDLVDDSGTVYATPYAAGGDMVAFTESGGLPKTFATAAVRLARSSVGIVAAGPGGVHLIAASTSRRVQGGGGTLGDRAAASGHTLFLYRDEQGVIEKEDSNGAIADELHFAVTPVVTHTPSGGSDVSYVMDHLSALVADAPDSIWFVENAPQAAYLVHATL